MRRYTEEDIKNVTYLLSRGLSLAEACKKLNFNRNGFRKRLVLSNIKLSKIEIKEALICLHCNQEKPLDQFNMYKSCVRRPSRVCKDCRNRQSRINTLVNKKVNISHKLLDNLIEIQGNKCAICGVEASNLKKALSIDHDHVTGGVRGLLCSSCNTGLGYFKDDISLLEKAILYIEKNA